MKRKLLIAIILIAAFYRVQSQALTLVTVQYAVPEMPFVSGQDLIDSDLYIRQIEGNRNSKIRVLVFIADESYFTTVLPNVNLNFIGYSGVTLSSYRWNWATNQADPDGERVALSVVRLFDNPAVMYGLILHELSHSAYTEHGNGTTLGDANYWERIGNAAYNRNCNDVHCSELERIIYDD